jgi:hypothetical protein
MAMIFFAREKKARRVQLGIFHTTKMMSSVATADDLYTWLDSQLATQVFAADSLEINERTTSEEESAAMSTTTTTTTTSSEYRDNTNNNNVIDNNNNNNNNIIINNKDDDANEIPVDADEDDDDEYEGNDDDDEDDDESPSNMRKSRRNAHKTNASSAKAPPSSIADHAALLQPAALPVIPIHAALGPTMMLPPPPQSNASVTTTTLSTTVVPHTRSGNKRTASSAAAAAGNGGTGSAAAAAAATGGAGAARSTTTAVTSTSKRSKTQQSHSCTNCSKAHRKCVVAQRNGRHYSCSACADRGLECSFKSLPIFLSPAHLLTQQSEAFADQRVLPSALASTIRTALIRTASDVTNATVAFLGSTPQYVMALRPRTPAETLAHGIPLPVFSDANDEFCEIVNRTHAELKLTPLFEVLRPPSDAVATNNRWAGWVSYVAPPNALTLDISSTPVLRTVNGWRRCKAHIKFYFQQDGPFAGRIAAVHGSIEHIGEEEAEEPPIPMFWNAMAQSVHNEATAAVAELGQSSQQQGETTGVVGVSSMATTSTNNENANAFETQATEAEAAAEPAQQQ